MKRSRALALAVALVAATTLASASHRSAADLTSRLVDSLPLSARGGGDPVPEAVLLAVHVRQSTNDTDSVERLAARAVADVDGRELTFATRDGDVERRRVDARVVFENDVRAPLTFARLNDVLGLREFKITPEKLVEASRAAERAHVGASFDVFSGVYGVRRTRRATTSRATPFARRASSLEAFFRALCTSRFDTWELYPPIARPHD